MLHSESTIKPAQPLPWECTTCTQPATIQGGGFCLATLWDERAPAPQHNPEQFPSEEDTAANTRYIVHACNAYPRLVAAIRDDLRGYLGDFPAGHAATKLRDLLRELGEEQ